MSAVARNDRVRSRDGTTIAYDRAGSGPAVILVGGGLTDRAENAPLARALAASFTVFNYDRRGRGASGDTPPYALEREIDDLAALIAAAGGAAGVFGASSGGALALEAVAAGLPIGRLAIYEVPYTTTAAGARDWQRYLADLGAALAEDRRDDAVARFMGFAGATDEDVAGARALPFWPDLVALGPTLAYDAACLGDGYPPKARLAAIARPTLVVTGRVAPGESHTPGLPPDFFDRAADAIAASIPGADRRVLAGQGHVADPQVLARVLARFF